MLPLEVGLASEASGRLDSSKSWHTELLEAKRLQASSFAAELAAQGVLDLCELFSLLVSFLGLLWFEPLFEMLLEFQGHSMCFLQVLVEDQNIFPLSPWDLPRGTIH